MKRLITGCARSGTKFISNLLSQLFLDMPHERLGTDGSVSWYAGGLKIKYPSLYDKNKFDIVLHQSRNAIETIESITTLKYWNYSNRGKNLPKGPSISYVSPMEIIPQIEDENLILQSAKFWYYFNTHIMSFAEWTYPVEKIIKDEEIFSEFCHRLKISEVPDNIFLNDNIHSRKHHSNRLMVNWDVLEVLDKDLTEKIRILNFELGYGDE
jgi:hypothetical protein